MNFIFSKWAQTCISIGDRLQRDDDSVSPVDGESLEVEVRRREILIDDPDGKMEVLL
jgi:hypothetical protein